MCRHFSIDQHRAINLLSRDWKGHLLIHFRILQRLHLLLVCFLAGLLVPNVITYLHLLLNQILGLHEGADEFVSLLALQVPHLRLVDRGGLLELLLTIIQLCLLVHQLLSQDTLLIVEVEEHAQVLRQLIILLRLNDALDLTLLGHFLTNLIDRVHLVFH